MQVGDCEESNRVIDTKGKGEMGGWKNLDSEMEDLTEPRSKIVCRFSEIRTSN